MNRLVALPAILLLSICRGVTFADTPAPPPPPPDAVLPSSRSTQPEHHGFTPHIHQHRIPAEMHEHLTGDVVQPRAHDQDAPSQEQYYLGFMQVFTVPENHFLINALIVGVLVAAVAAYVGLYIVLKRVVFVGLALAEVSSAGVALGLALGINPIIGSIAAMAVGVVLFSIRWSPRRIPQDAFIGVGFAFASAAALLLVATSPVGESHMLDLLKGDILTIQPFDIWATAIGLALVMAVHGLFYKELLFTSFDPGTTTSLGYNTRLWEIVLFATVGLTIALGIHATGILFTSGCLVIPATGALLLSRKFSKCGLIAVVMSVVPVPVGLYLSYVRDLPPSATVIGVSFLTLIAIALTAKSVAALIR